MEWWQSVIEWQKLAVKWQNPNRLCRMAYPQLFLTNVWHNWQQHFHSISLHTMNFKGHTLARTFLSFNLNWDLSIMKLMVKSSLGPTAPDDKISYCAPWISKDVLFLTLLILSPRMAKLVWTQFAAFFLLAFTCWRGDKRFIDCRNWLLTAKFDCEWSSRLHSHVLFEPLLLTDRHGTHEAPQSTTLFGASFLPYHTILT